MSISFHVHFLCCVTLCASLNMNLIMTIVMLCLKLLVMPRLNCFRLKINLEILSGIFGAIELKDLI